MAKPKKIPKGTWKSIVDHDGNVVGKTYSDAKTPHGDTANAIHFYKKLSQSMLSQQFTKFDADKPISPSELNRYLAKKLDLLALQKAELKQQIKAKSAPGLSEVALDDLANMVLDMIAAEKAKSTKGPIKQSLSCTAPSLQSLSKKKPDSESNTSLHFADVDYAALETKMFACANAVLKPSSPYEDIKDPIVNSHALKDIATYFAGKNPPQKNPKNGYDVTVHAHGPLGPDDTVTIAGEKYHAIAPPSGAQGKPCKLVKAHPSLHMICPRCRRPVEAKTPSPGVLVDTFLSCSFCGVGWAVRALSSHDESWIAVSAHSDPLFRKGYVVNAPTGSGFAAEGAWRACFVFPLNPAEPPPAQPELGHRLVSARPGRIDYDATIVGVRTLALPLQFVFELILQPTIDDIVPLPSVGFAFHSPIGPYKFTPQALVHVGKHVGCLDVESQFTRAAALFSYLKHPNAPAPNKWKVTSPRWGESTISDLIGMYLLERLDTQFGIAVHDLSDLEFTPHQLHETLIAIPGVHKTPQ